MRRHEYEATLGKEGVASNASWRKIWQRREGGTVEKRRHEYEATLGKEGPRAKRAGEKFGRGGKVGTVEKRRDGYLGEDEGRWKTYLWKQCR
jgi:hypothetical protein